MIFAYPCLCVQLGPKCSCPRTNTLRRHGVTHFCLDWLDTHGQLQGFKNPTNRLLAVLPEVAEEHDRRGPSWTRRLVT
jgi:hypothetical protein